jgi:DNA-binding NtrC family response regulator
MYEETIDGTRDRVAFERRPCPGLVAVFCGHAPAWIPIPLRPRTDDESRQALTLGRGALPEDPRLSRAHAEVSVGPDGWTIRDLGSRNGTSVDGAVVDGVVVVRAPRVIRVADTVLIPLDDVTGLEAPRAGAGGMIVGALLADALGRVARAAGYSRTLVLHGESGAGKELAAREFHARGPNAKGPFVAVNCATIPQGLAERLLFGTKRGAYSGADADAVGHLAAAHLGVLFLDEVAELDLGAQAKLLRVLESGEILPLGAQRAQQVDVRICVATHRNLRDEAAAGRFREDLLYRLSPPEAVLPPLRERRDEIVAHIVAEVSTAPRAIGIHPALVETCLLRAWPGNVRELRKHIREALATALAGNEDRVRASHLAATAGLALARAETSSRDAAPAAAAEDTSAPETPASGANEPDADAPAGKRSYVRWSASLTREQIEAALASNDGNMAGAARSLGMNRSQLYREVARHAVGTSSNGSDTE